MIWTPSRVNGLVSIRDEFFTVLLSAPPAFSPYDAPELFLPSGFFGVRDVDLVALAVAEIWRRGSWGEDGWSPCSGTFD